ncbi:hypothetical protein PRIC2_007192 [Phytophthora ramorum]
MMSTMKSSIALLLALVAVSSSVSDATSLRQDHRDLNDMAAATYTQTNQYASAILARVNKERAAHGLPSLCSNKKLQAAAQRHAKDQSRSDYMSDYGTDNSTPESRVSDAGFKCQHMAENIDSGNANAGDVVDWWMKNVGRDRILDKSFTMAGAAYVYNDNTSSKHYWVQIYASGISESCDP